MRCPACKGKGYVWVIGGAHDELIQDICEKCNGGDDDRPPVCRAVNCDCINFAPGRSLSGYVNCAGCLHTEQVHQARKRIKQVKRG